MGWWSSRSGVPAAVLSALDLADGERVLANAGTPDGDLLVATDRGLWIPERPGHRRIGWESVDRATWDRDGDLLTVVEAAPLGQRPRQHLVRITVAGRLPEVVRERVNAAVVITRFVPIKGERGIRVIGRRRTGAQALAWTVSVDSGVDMDQPAVKALVDATLAETRAEVGE